MPAPSLITDLSTTAATNSPAGSENVFPNLDDYLRAQSAFLASIRDNSGNGWVSPYLSTAALASPPAIGGTLPAAGTFTNLTVNGTLSGAGVSTYLAAPPAIGGTTPAAISGTTGTFSGNVQMASLNGGAISLRNKIINGDMRVAQRGTSLTASAGVATYTLDRWKVSATGAAVTVTRGSASTAYSNLANYLTVTGAAGNTLVNAQQYIESSNSRDLAGQTVTLSYWVYNNTGSSFTATSGFYYPTVSDVFTTVTTIAATAGGTVCPNATWTQVTVSQAIPAAATTGLQIVLGANNQAVLAGQSISFGNAQLEVGPVATPFEQRPIGMELALCQRYYQTIANNAVRVTTYSLGSSGVLSPLGSLPVEMRVAPTVVQPTFTYTNASAASVSIIGTSFARVSWTATTSSTTAISTSTETTLSSEL